MKIMVIGGGGREHAIIKKLKESATPTEIYALPGNGGIAADAQCVPIPATDIDGICRFARENNIGFAVVAPDDPLVMGAVDALETAGVLCFGPNKAAAIIEGSKSFSKELMKKYNIPTAEYEVFTDLDNAVAFLRKNEKGGFAPPFVIKADGLALGKGVIITSDLDEAVAAVTSMVRDKAFGDSGSTVVIEQHLTGPEVSVLAFTDGETLIPMVSSMDHKRALDGDNGLNTGGMGVIAPNPFYTEEIAKQCMQEIFLPTMNAMNAEGRRFKGCLYFGLMLTPHGPKVIEYNCRFGDPETQAVLPLLESDLLEIMLAVSQERLSQVPVKFSGGASVCVIIASGGYPQSYEKGKPITIGDTGDCVLYHAGTAFSDGQLVTSGGRVLGVTAAAGTLKEAIDNAYAGAMQVKFEGAYKRSDIGKKVL